MDELNPNENVNEENTVSGTVHEASEAAASAENTASRTTDGTENAKPSKGSFYDDFFKDKPSENFAGGGNNASAPVRENTQTQGAAAETPPENDAFAEADIDSMFHLPPKGTLPPPGYGSVNYGGYGNPYANPPMRGGYPPNGGAPYHDPMRQGGYGSPYANDPAQGGYPPNGSMPYRNPMQSGMPMQQGTYNAPPEYRQSTYNPYGASSSVYVPKKKNLSNSAFMGIIIAISVLFVVILVILAFTSIDEDAETDYSTKSSASDSKDSGNRNVSVEIPIQQKPALEEKYYADEETGLLTVAGVAKRVSPSVVDVLVYRDTSLYAYSAGSGVIMSAEGYIVTNAHVVTEANAGLKVTLGDGTEFEAEIVGSDSRTDIAVLKIDPKDKELVCADFGDSDELELGEMVVAIGNAGGYSGTLTVGYVSGLDREIKTKSSGSDGIKCIQTDAAMSPGVSGGALINMYGQVVGITSSKYKSSDLDEGIGFAITTKFAKPIIEDIITKGYISGRVRVGITYVAISDSMAESYGVKRGLQVKSIDDSCDISNTELKTGDIITSINDTEVYSAETIRSAMEGIGPGDTIRAHVYRKGITSDDEEEFDIEFEAMQDTNLS